MIDDEGLVDYKIAVLKEAIAALEAERTDKIVMMDIEEPSSVDLMFYVFRFTLSGPALERLDEAWLRAGGIVRGES